MDNDLMAKINELETATLKLISVLEYKETHEVTYALNELNCAVFLLRK